MTSMKNLLLPLLILSCLKLSAQIEKPILKGNYIIGGSVSMKFNSLNENLNYTTGSGNSNPESSVLNNSSYNLELSPQIGYFIINGLAVGISPVYSYSNTKETQTRNDSIAGSVFSNKISSNTNTNSIGAGVFIKYYSTSGFFLNLMIQYQYNTSKYTAEFSNFTPGTSNIIFKEKANTNIHSNRIAVSPGLGYAIFLKSNISLEPMISYFYSRNSQSSSNSFNSIEESSGITDKGRAVYIENTKNSGIYFTLGLNFFIK